jgi:hypothetical protein
MLQGLKPLTMNTLFPQGSDHTIDRPDLFRTLWRDELLLQAIAPHQGGELTAGDDQANVESKRRDVMTH